MPTNPDTWAELGAIIGGKYRLDRMLGHGGMGAIYAAENTALLAPVAIKLLGLPPNFGHLGEGRALERG